MSNYYFVHSVCSMEEVILFTFVTPEFLVRLIAVANDGIILASIIANFMDNLKSIQSIHTNKIHKTVFSENVRITLVYQFYVFMTYLARSIDQYREKSRLWP